MNKENVCIATLCWARDEKEETLLRTSLKALSLLDIPVYITDGGSPQNFLEFIRSLPKIKLLPAAEGGVWPQVKNSLAAAFTSNTPFIFYTEPDKLDFFAQWLLSIINAAVGGERLGILLASRTADGFATFPSFQQMTEATINNCCAEIMQKKADYTYGPFLLNKNLIPYLDGLKNDIGWGWRPYLFCAAKRLGYKVTAVEGSFTCPEDQRVDNEKERIYRMSQLSQNIQGIVLAAKQYPDNR